MRLAPEVTASLNRRHVAFFNLERLSTLDTLGLVLYKRVFYNFSILLQEGKGRRTLKLARLVDSGENPRSHDRHPRCG